MKQSERTILVCTNLLSQAHIKMKVNKLRLTTLLLFLNSIYFVKTYLLHDSKEEEASGTDINVMSLDDPLDRISKYEENIFIMEEKVKSLSKTINQLELKMVSLLNDNMNTLENNLRKIMEQIVGYNRGIKKIESSYNIQELKCSNNRFPASCQEVNECNSNIYSIMVPEINDKPFPVVCDLKTIDGGWTIIQRRQDGSENFYRNWTDYVAGFGNMNGEFFIGLEKLYALTSLGEPQELYIILEDFEGERRYARYGNFKVGSEITEYKLGVSDYWGDAGDCFTRHNGHKFTTKDRDNDVSKKNCAELWKGAWWYTDCFQSNLNGLYLSGKTPKSKSGVSWCAFRRYGYSLKFVQMMIRSKTD